MVRGAISLYEVTPPKYMEGRQDSINYVDVLRNGLLPFASEVFGEGQCSITTGARGGYESGGWHGVHMSGRAHV